jgi:Domain of unknown function (DUF932)
MTALGTLCLHRGGVRHTRAELATLPTPEATDTWKPVPHFELISTLIEGLEKHQIEIKREEYATSGNDHARFFGVLDLVIPGLAQPDYAMALGIRGANDRSMAIQATAGARVFVCDNLAFSGESGTVVLKKKHTSRLDLSAVVPPAIDAYLERAGQFVVDINEMKNIELADARAKEVVYNAFIRDRIMPLRFLPAVHATYFDDREQREKFEARSMWSLNNAFTEVVKQFKPVPQQNASVQIGRYFGRTLRMELGKNNRFVMADVPVADGQIELNGVVLN